MNYGHLIEFCIYIDLAESKAFPLVLVLGCSLAALLVLLVTVLLLVRRHRGKFRLEQKRREARKKEGNELEMEVLQSGNDETEDPGVNIFLYLI